MPGPLLPRQKLVSKSHLCRSVPPDTVKKTMFLLLSTGVKYLLHVPNNKEIDTDVYSRQKLLDPRYNSEIKTNGTSDVSLIVVNPMAHRI